MSSNDNSGAVEEETRAPLSNMVTLLLAFHNPHLFSSAADDKSGTPPASKAAIEALPRVLVTEVKDCTICLQEISVGEEAREMPCKHGFHSDCIEKWLGIHGSCPVCRYVTPPVEEEKEEKEDVGRGGGDDRVIMFTLSVVVTGVQTESSNSY